MALTKTEQRHSASKALDTLPPESALSAICDVQISAAISVRGAITDIARAAEAVAACLKAGGRLVYAGAGSSGLMALADALEVPGTFGIPREQIVILLSEGIETIAQFDAESEDDATRGTEAVQALRLGDADCMIALSASGTTPYALAAIEAARASGAKTIAIANNAGAPLLERADIAIHLDTPPEIIAGSTRMGAGTAQKIALNMISTQAGIHMGHIHEGYMVNVQPENAKLQGRTRHMVRAISGCDEEAAAASVAAAGGRTKLAVLLASGAGSLEAAAAMLEQSGGVLRPALQRLHAREGQNCTAPEGASIGAAT